MGQVFRRLMLLVLTIFLSSSFSTIRAQTDKETQKKVLVFHLMRRDDAAVLEKERVYQNVLSRGLAGQLDYYSEHVDLARFGVKDYQKALRDFLKQKYKGSNFDLIITSADLQTFLVKFGDELFPNTPVVFAKGDDVADSKVSPNNFTGITFESDRRGTLDVIRKLQPTVKRIFVVSGASEAVDKWHEDRARKQFKAYGNRFEFIYLSGLRMEELKRRVSRLTTDSVVYFVMMAEDGAGKRFVITDALDQIAAASSVPVYTWHDSFLSHGVVGGKLLSSEKSAEQTAAVALRILRGERPDAIPITRVDASRLAFDWRQLQRWKLDESRLPPASEILFREATFWQRYQNHIIGVIAVLAIQSALIMTLLVERRRRQKAIIRLKDSEARYRNVVDTQTELICRFLPDTRLTFVNEAYCRYFGRTKYQLVGTKFIFLIPESERESMLRYVESLVERPRTETKEHPVIGPDGSCSWHQWTSSVISTVPSVEIQGVGRDISTRKHLEQQLVRSEREFSRLVENSPDVICRLNRDRRFIYVSPNLDGIFGLGVEAFIGKRPSEVTAADYDSSEFEFRCEEAIDKRLVTKCDFHYRGRYYRTRIIPEYSSDGDVESVMTISEDFTDRRRTELELTKLTTRLLTLQDEERRKIARELHDGAAQNMFALTMNLSRLGKELNHRSPRIKGVLSDSQQLAEESLSELRTITYLLHPPVLDQTGLADALHWLARGFSKRSGIQVDTSAVQEIGRLAPDCERALFRIVQESLTNVRRHSGSDTAYILLERSDGEVKLHVQDHGHGMPPVGAGAAEGTSEFGVGIPGMRQRLTQLGGRIKIDSSDRGTTIIVVVPTTEEEVAVHAASG
jgi:PAS domain S-box-containing protein